MADDRRRHLKILVASPGDVDAERKIVEKVIEDWNIRNGEERKMVLEAVLWEKHAAPRSRGEGEGPQEHINRQIVDDCDCVIGIFWNRIGTPTPMAAGGAVEEVQRMMTILKRPVMLYFSDMPIAPSKIDDQQKFFIYFGTMSGVAALSLMSMLFFRYKGKQPEQQQQLKE